jgi:hypothetical protein
VSAQHHAPAALSPGKKPDAHWIGGFMGPRAGLDDMENRKICWLCRDSNQRMVHPLAYSLYRLLCAGSSLCKSKLKTTFEAEDPKFFSADYRLATQERIASWNTDHTQRCANWSFLWDKCGRGCRFVAIFCLAFVVTAFRRLFVLNTLHMELKYSRTCAWLTITLRRYVDKWRRYSCTYS